MLEVRNLHYNRGDLDVLRAINFIAQPGELLHIEGPNGSGKTTLLRILCGLVENYEGEIFWQRELLKDIKSSYWQQLNYIGHQTGLKEGLSAIENLQGYLALRKHSSSATQIEWALMRVGMQGLENIPIKNLSAGQKQRVALAKLLIYPATIWLLDEPFTAIDHHGIATLEALFVEQVQAGLVIMTTHHALELPGISVKQLYLSS